MKLRRNGSGTSWLRSISRLIGRMTNFPTLWMPSLSSCCFFGRTKSIMALSPQERRSGEDGLRVGRGEHERGVERRAEIDRRGDLIELLRGRAAERDLLGVAHQFFGDEIADEARAAVERDAVVAGAHRRLER